METRTVLWLIRHPEPVQSTFGMCYGALDVPLSEHGIHQAESLKATLAKQNLSAVYSSPLQRCAYSAAMIANAAGCKLEIVDALRELDFGEFEGRPYDEIRTSFPELYDQWMTNPAEVQFPRGEDLRTMSQRVLDGRQTLISRHQNETVAFVTHGGPIRVILAAALGIDDRNIFRIGQQYGGISRISYVDGIPTIDFMNRDLSD